MLETLVYKKQDLKAFKNEAINLYQAFYNYSDEKFNAAIKLKPVRILLKYFIENSKYISSIRRDEDKEIFLDEFYELCKN